MNCFYQHQAKLKLSLTQSTDLISPSYCITYREDHRHEDSVRFCVTQECSFREIQVNHSLVRVIIDKQEQSSPTFRTVHFY